MLLDSLEDGRLGAEAQFLEATAHACLKNCDAGVVWLECVHVPYSHNPDNGSGTLVLVPSHV